MWQKVSQIGNPVLNISSALMVSERKSVKALGRPIPLFVCVLASYDLLLLAEVYSSERSVR